MQEAVGKVAGALVAMTADQWAEMLTAVTTAVTVNMPGYAQQQQQQQQYQQQFAAAVPPPQTGHKSGTRSGRHIHLNKFDGNLSAWDDWSWQFINVIISQYSTVAMLMSEAEVAEDEVDEDLLGQEVQPAMPTSRK